MVGFALGCLGIIISDTAYAVVAPTTPWINPSFPGQSPATIENGTVTQIVI